MQLNTTIITSSYERSIFTSFPEGVNSKVSINDSATTVAGDTMLTFRDADPLTFWSTLNIVCTVLGLIGIVGNLLACVVIVRYRPLRKRPANYFIANQCLLDLNTSVALILIQTLDYTLRNVTGRALVVTCYLVSNRIMYTGAFCASVWNLTALAVERYLKIVHPNRYKQKITGTKIVAVCVSIWLLCYIYRICLQMPLIKVIDNKCYAVVYANSTASIMSGIAVFLIDFFVPLMGIAGCYQQITRALSQKIANESTIESGNGYSKMLSLKDQRAIVKLLVTTSAVFLITVGPRQIYILFMAFAKKPLDINASDYLICLMMSYVNGAINPFIYAWKYDDFRQGVKHLFRWQFNNVAVGASDVAHFDGSLAENVVGDVVNPAVY